MNMKILKVLTLIVLCSSMASGAIVFQDSFTSGTAAEAGYYRFGTTGTTLAVDGGDLDYTYAATTSSRSGVIKSFSDQTLSNVGDNITFAFDLSQRTLGSLQSHSFRWAIGNLGNPSEVTGVPVTADLTSATPFGSGTREMFQFSASTSTTTGFGQYVTGSSSPVHNQSGTATAIASFTGPASIATSGAGSVTLTITKTLTGYDVAQTAFGVTSSGTLTTGTDIFNTIAFSMNNAGTLAFSLDNVTVTAVPEPATTALMLGFATLGFILWWRRR